jgi:hypothetical protein
MVSILALSVNFHREARMLCGPRWNRKCKVEEMFLLHSWFLTMLSTVLKFYSHVISDQIFSVLVWVWVSITFNLSAQINFGSKHSKMSVFMDVWLWSIGVVLIFFHKLQTFFTAKKWAWKIPWYVLIIQATGGQGWFFEIEKTTSALSS